MAEFITLIGRAYLAMLNALDRADQLGPESDFKDLALVSGLYTTIPDLFPDSYDDEKLDWRQYVGDYMEASRIDISFVYGSLKLKTGGKVKDLNGRKGIPKAGADRWGFKSAVSPESWTFVVRNLTIPAAYNVQERLQCWWEAHRWHTIRYHQDVED